MDINQSHSIQNSETQFKDQTPATQKSILEKKQPSSLTTFIKSVQKTLGFGDFQNRNWSSPEKIALAAIPTLAAAGYITYNYFETGTKTSVINHSKSSITEFIGTTLTTAAALGVSFFANNFTHAATKVSNAGLSLIDSIYSEPKWVKEKFRIGVDNVFEKFRTPLYPSLDFNIDDNIENEFELLVSKIFKSEYDEKDNNSINNHTEFLTNLRAALKTESFKDALAFYHSSHNSTKEHDHLVDVLLELCRIRFEEGHFFEFFDETMDTLGLKKDGNVKFSKDDFRILDHIDYKHKMCTPQNRLESAQGHFNINFDPHLKGNIPYVLGTLTVNGKPVKLLRIGTITQQGLNSVEIIPEFKGYLTSLLRQEKNHLYISLQNDLPKSLGGDETGRNATIKQLQEEYKNFFVVVLAQDSPFYKQEGKGPQMSEEFLDEFEDQMLGENTGFYFPDDWKKDPKFRENIRELLKFVHTVLFNKNGEYQPIELSVKKKLDFIEIFYAYLSVFLMSYSKADNANISCKDAVDRAGKLNSLLLQLFLIIEGKADDKRYQRVHQVMTHMPAMWVKGRSILHHRRDRLLTAFKRMYDNKQRISDFKLFMLDEEGNMTVPLVNPEQPVKFEIDFSKINNFEKEQQPIEQNLSEVHSTIESSIQSNKALKIGDSVLEHLNSTLMIQ